LKTKQQTEPYDQSVARHGFGDSKIQQIREKLVKYSTFALP
jgi:hypothetical protein